MLAAALGGEWRVARVADAFGAPRERALAPAPGRHRRARVGGRRSARPVPARCARRVEPWVRGADPRRARRAPGGAPALPRRHGDDGCRRRPARGRARAAGAGARALRRALHAPRGSARLRAAEGRLAGDVAELERRFAADDELRPYAGLAGAGAAGGLGAALASLGAELVPGARHVLETIGLPARLAGADLVVTGEGRVDASTATGKAPAAVAEAARAARRPLRRLRRAGDRAARRRGDGRAVRRPGACGGRPARARPET